MIICSACSKYFSGTPFTLLDNHRICPSCFEAIKSGRGLFPLPNPPKPPEKPGFFTRIFSFYAKQDYQDKMSEYDRAKTIHEQEYNRIRELSSEIEHEVKKFGKIGVKAKLYTLHKWLMMVCLSYGTAVAD
jgi:hypothetical protein